MINFHVHVIDLTIFKLSAFKLIKYNFMGKFSITCNKIIDKIIAFHSPGSPYQQHFICDLRLIDIGSCVISK